MSRSFLFEKVRFVRLTLFHISIQKIGDERVKL